MTQTNQALPFAEGDQAPSRQFRRFCAASTCSFETAWTRGTCTKFTTLQSSFHFHFCWPVIRGKLVSSESFHFRFSWSDQLRECLEDSFQNLRTQRKRCWSFWFRASTKTKRKINCSEHKSECSPTRLRMQKCHEVLWMEKSFFAKCNSKSDVPAWKHDVSARAMFFVASRNTLKEKCKSAEQRCPVPHQTYDFRKAALTNVQFDCNQTKAAQPLWCGHASI